MRKKINIYQFSIIMPLDRDFTPTIKFYKNVTFHMIHSVISTFYPGFIMISFSG